MKSILRFSLFVLVSILVGCQKDDQNKDLISKKWYLQSIKYTDTQSEDIAPENLKGMNVVFSDSNKLHAFSSCNVFDGDFITIPPDILSVTNLGRTLIFCTDSNRMLWESYFFENLKNSINYSLKDGTLSIRTNKNTIMIFK
jgi:heat shock protein HslJ